MKIKSIYFENLYSYEKVEFNFDKFPGGTTLLLGKSLDDKSSNGAGKTSIMKALYFGLYGMDVYKANRATILRRGATTGWYVKVTFEDRGHDYVIERFEGRKDKSSVGKGLNFFIDGEKFNGVDGGIDETQSIINQKLRISPELFKSAVYSVQNASKNFLETSDTDKKDLLAELLDLQVYSKAFAHIKDEIKDLIERQKDKENKIETNQAQIQTLAEQVKQLSTKRDSFDEEKEKEALIEITKINEITSKISLVESPVEKYDLKKIVESINSLKQEKSQLDAKLSDENKMQNTLAKINAELEQNEKYLKESFISISKLENLIKDLDSIVFDAQEKENVLSKKEQINKELKLAESSKEMQNSVFIEINDLKNKTNNILKDVSSLEKEIKVLTESEECPTCHRTYEEEHLKHVKEGIEKLSLKKEALLSDAAQVDNELKLKEKEASDLLSDVAQIDFLKKALAALEKNYLSINLLEQKFTLKEEEKLRHHKSIEDVRSSMESRKEASLVLTQRKAKGEKMMEELVPVKRRQVEIDQEVSQLNASQIQAEVEESRLEQLRLSKDEMKAQLERHQSSLNKIKNEDNPYGSMIESLEKKTVFFEDKISQYKEMLKKDETEMKYLNFWKIGFAPTGIQSFITDDVIDLLNRKVQDNLNDLFNGALSVLFDPESKNKKGIVSNKISTNIFHNGKETSFELLSGGEKRRAILATNLALTEVAESRSGTKLNICFLDEPFDGIDSAGQLVAFRLFNRLSNDKDGFFVISHDPQFQEMCQSVVYILKKNEISRIVDKKTFDEAEIITDTVHSDRSVLSTVLEDNEKSKKDLLAEKLKAWSKKKDE